MGKKKKYGRGYIKKYKKNSLVGVWELLKVVIISFALITALLIIIE